LSILVLEY